MAIDLFSLDKPEATLVRPQIQPQSYRLNTDKIKENWEELKSQSKDLVQVSNQAASYESTISTEDIINLGELNRNYTNYSSDVFFRKNAPQISTDGNYRIGGVNFTKEEMERCRVVMQAAAESIGCGVGKNTNIDYKNYAEMGIAVSAVKTFGEENLTEEQANVLNKAMQEYNQALIDLEQKMFSEGNYVDCTHEGLSDYYGKERILGDSEIEAINKLKEEMSKITGRYYAPTVSGATAHIASATNEEVIGEVSELFSNMDCTDEQSIDEVTAKYMEMMKPVYTAYGMNDAHGSLSKVLNSDAANFKKQISNILMAMNYHGADYRI